MCVIFINSIYYSNYYGIFNIYFDIYIYIYIYIYILYITTSTSRYNNYYCIHHYQTYIHKLAIANVCM